jgi:hypothetical protein
MLSMRKQGFNITGEALDMLSLERTTAVQAASQMPLPSASRTYSTDALHHHRNTFL